MAENQILIKFKPSGDKDLINAINKLATAQRTLEARLKATNKKTGVLDTSNKRLAATNGLLANSFATIRSKMLLWSFAMTMGIRQIGIFGKEAAKVESLAKAFGTLSGGAEGASSAMGKLQNATNGTMSQFDLFQQANNAMILGVTKNSDEMAEMFDMAQRLGAALGKDTKMSVESLITGIGRQSRMMLDNIGIVVKVEKAYKAYALELGKDASALTEIERKQAFFNATLGAAREKIKFLPKEINTAEMAFNALGAAVEDAKANIGMGLLPVLKPMAEIFTKMSKLIDPERVRAYATIISTTLVVATAAYVKQLKLAVLWQTRTGWGVMATAAGVLASELVVLSGIFKDSSQPIDDLAAKTQSYLEKLLVMGKIDLIAQLAEQEQAYINAGNEMDTVNNRMNTFKEQIEVLKQAGGEHTETIKNLEAQLRQATDAYNIMLGVDYEHSSEKEREAIQKNIDTITKYINVINAGFSSFQSFTESQDQAAAMYLKTDEGQRATIAGNIAMIEGLIKVDGKTKELVAVLKMLEDQYNKIGSAAKQNADLAVQTAGQINAAFSKMTSAQSENLNARMKNDMDRLKKSEMYENASAKRKQKLEEGVQKKFSAERKKIWKQQRQAKLSQALIDGYGAVTKTFNQFGFPWGVIPAGIVAGLVASQVSAIASTPMPKFAQGGLVGGRLHSQGGTMIEAEQGEFVMSRNAVDAIGTENLNRMNRGGGGAVNVTFTGNVMSQDFIENEAIPQIKEAVRRGADIGVA